MPNHARDAENVVATGLGLGLMGIEPVLRLLAPFIIAGFALLLAFLFMGWTFAAAMLPLTESDVALDDLLTTRFGGDSAVWGGFALVSITYGIVGGTAWYLRRSPRLNLGLLAAVLAGYALFVALGERANGNRFLAQVSYAQANPGRSATRAWNCPTSLADGTAEREGRYDMHACLGYATQDQYRAACRQVMRHMSPLSGPQNVCSSYIRDITKHTWPIEGVVYRERLDERDKFRSPPLATPAIMRELLAKEGLTPRT